jgi:hypothetical protein
MTLQQPGDRPQWRSTPSFVAHRCAAELALWAGNCSHEVMEPISALLVLAGAHGAKALVQALSGSADLGELSSDLFKALAESESRIDARLSNIENVLDVLLEQRYQVALASGVRFLLDGMTGPTNSTVRFADLDRARQSFVEATSAAQSSLQRAIAERYLLLCLTSQGRMDLAPASLSRLESAAMIAAFDTCLGEIEILPAAVDLRRRHGKAPKWGSSDYPGAEVREIESAVEDAMGMCGRMLAEASVLAPVFGLPPRRSPIEGQRLVDHLVPGIAMWNFRVDKGTRARIGCITVEFLPASIGSDSETITLSTHDKQKERKLLPILGYMRLEINPPLPRSFIITTVHQIVINQYHYTDYYAVQAGTTRADVPLPKWLVRPEDSVIRDFAFTPNGTTKTLISLKWP